MIYLNTHFHQYWGQYNGSSSKQSWVIWIIAPKTILCLKSEWWRNDLKMANCLMRLLILSWQAISFLCCWLKTAANWVVGRAKGVFKIPIVHKTFVSQAAFFMFEFRNKFLTRNIQIWIFSTGHSATPPNYFSFGTQWTCNSGISALRDEIYERSNPCS